MKLIMTAAALVLGTAAVAQTTTDQDTTATQTSPTDPTAETTTDATTDTTVATSAPAPGNLSTMRTPTGQAVAPDNSAPERDARGIPVISAPATAPAGYNQGAQSVPAGTPPPTVASPTPTAAGPLPPCTRTVTDRCTQTYERGRAR